jgi:hypothetical protein
MARPKKTTTTEETSCCSGTTTTCCSGSTDRHQLIAQRAFTKAQQRNFVGGTPEQDWFDAEREIERELNKKKQ